MWVLQEELLRAPAASSTNLILAGFLSQKLWGLTFLALNPWLGILGWGWDSSLLKYPSQIFILKGLGPVCSESTPLLPVWMDVVVNSIVVRLPFNLISDVPE